MFSSSLVDRNVLNQSQLLMTRSDGQPLSLSSAYVNWSPVSHRKAMKPAGVSAQISEPSPNPVHFNRPSPKSSPIFQRKVGSGCEPIRRQALKSDIQNSATIHNRSKGSDKFQSSNESSATCKIITPQRGEDIYKQKKEEYKKVEPLRHNGMPMHFTGETWQTPNYKLITPMSCSLKEQSLAKKEIDENTSENVGEYFSSVSIVRTGVETPIASQVQKASIQTSAKSPQSPTPWRKVKKPGGTSAKSDAAIAGNQPSWRRQDELKNIKVESVSSVYNSAMISAKPQAVLSHQKQAQIPSTKGDNQQEQQPVYEEAPWRSPQSKRKEYNKPSSAPKTKEVSTTPFSVLSDKQAPVLSASFIPQVSTSIVSIPPSNASTLSASTTAPSCIQAVPPSSHQDVNIITPQSGSNVPHKPPLPAPPLTVSSTLTTITSATVSASESVKPEEITLVKGDIQILEETNEKIVTSTEQKSSEDSMEESVTKKSDDKSKEVSVQGEHKESTVFTEAQEVVASDVPLPPPSTTTTEEQTKKSENQYIPPPPPSNVETLVKIPQFSDSDNVVENEPLSPLPTICKSDNTVNYDQQPPAPPPPPPKNPTSQPTTRSLPIRLSNPNLQSENTEPSADFIQEPVTSRIQRFEKQSSFERELKEKQMATAKPVGPWVKKTSSGPVQQDMWGDQTSYEKPWPEPPPANYYEADSYSKMSSAVPNLPHMTSDGAPEFLALQHKQIKKLMQRPRTKSTGDYSHSYLDNGEPIPVGQDKPKSPLVQSKQGVSSLVKGDAKKSPTEQLFDPLCDPNNPKVIQFQDVSAAAFKIKSGIMNTPCTRSNMSAIVNMDVFFKKEFNQYTGSFKERGARYTLLCLTDEQKNRGVIAASAGNHALALSYHGQNLGIPVTVVMPLVAPIMKVQACRQYGANVLVKGNDIGECKEIALRMAKEQNLLYINGYDHPHILAGQGTMGLEIVEQVSNIDAVVVPVGGGGLIAGVALAVKSLYPHVKVIGVEAEKCASYTAAMKAGKPVYVKAESSLADGLAVPMTGVNAFATAANLVDKVVTVREEWIAIAILRLVEMEKAVVEGAGAAALAALLAGELPELIGKRVVIPLCGGNIDTTVLGRCLERGLAADGRLVKFTVTVSDRPGGIADLTRLLANLGVSIKDMLHERAWIKSDIFSVEVKVLCETRDHEHSEELRQALLVKYKELRFGAAPE